MNKPVFATRSGVLGKPEKTGEELGAPFKLSSITAHFPSRYLFISRTEKLTFIFAALSTGAVAEW